MATPAVERPAVTGTPVDAPRANGRAAAPPAPPAPPSPTPRSTAPPPAPAAPAPAAQGGWGIPMVVLVTGMFMSVLDVSIVNVAIPTMQRDFGSTTEEIQWVATAYSLALGVIVPVSAWAGDRFGSTRVYNISLLGFAAGSALCGLAWNLNSMIVFRVIQAIPGGVLPVVTLTILYRIVPREKIGAAMGMYGLGHHRRAGRRAHAGRLPRGVRRLAADLLHQRARRHRRLRRGAGGAAPLPRSPLGELRRVGLPRHRDRAVHAAAGADRGPGLGLDVLQGPHPAHGGRAQPRAVHRDRARGRQPAAGRARLPLLAVHQLAAAHLGAVGRPVHRAVLRPALPAAVPGPRRLRGRPAPAAAGAGHGGVHAGRRPACTTASARAGRP